MHFAADDVVLSLADKLVACLNELRLRLATVMQLAPSAMPKPLSAEFHERVPLPRRASG